MKPLPKLPVGSSQPSLDVGSQGNAGLWFNRFFDQYGTDEDKEDRNEWGIGKTAKLNWLKQFPKAGLGDEAALTQHAARSIRMIQAQGGDFAIFKTDWHFITGMGYPHPVENGLVWHPTLGVPYLSGAAVKGLLRSWMEVWEKLPPAELRCLFGSESKQPEELLKTPPVAGELVFFDALPVSPVSLTVDIMTPHMGKWYEQGGDFGERTSQGVQTVANAPDAVPADWHSPVPVQYLVVKDAEFLVGIAPRRKKDLPKGTLQTMLDHLTQALEFMGAGAKTSVGYGQMSRNDQHQLKQGTLSVDARCKAEILAMTDRQLAELLGKKYNNLVDDLAREPAKQKIFWQLLWQLKQDVLLSWKDADRKKSLEGKAYKRLCSSEYLPEMGNMS